MWCKGLRCRASSESRDLVELQIVASVGVPKCIEFICLQLSFAETLAYTLSHSPILTSAFSRASVPCHLDMTGEAPTRKRPVAHPTSVHTQRFTAFKPHRP